MPPMVYILYACILHVAYGFVQPLANRSGLFAVLVYLAAIRVDDP